MFWEKLIFDFQKTKTTSSGLKERMKAFESTNRSNLVRRETVTAGERAADIRSRISGWGNFAESNGYQVCTDGKDSPDKGSPDFDQKPDLLVFSLVG